MVEKTPVTVPTKKIKYLGINLTSNVQNLCEENFKSILKEAKVDKNK